MVVVVTGANGQLGQALQAIAPQYNNIQFYFAGSADTDITVKDNLVELFNKTEPDFCINAAAYTAVDKAESEPDKAHLINVTGAKNLAEVCNNFKCTLIHISTDFVFDGTKASPYTEEDATNPTSVYGRTKREGEIAIQNTLAEHYIIRTSWLYSEFSNNFMKTMIRLSQDRDILNIVNDQVGTPTNANSLAKAILEIISLNKAMYGIYHYSNDGEATWYEFAMKIFEVNNISIILNPITTAEYPTPATRPPYSVLDTSKISKAFSISNGNWKDYLQKL